MSSCRWQLYWKELIVYAVKKKKSIQLTLKKDCQCKKMIVAWAQFFPLAQIPPLASSGCMRDIRVCVKHWQLLIACSTDQLSVLNNLPILLGAPEKRFWEATPRPLEIASFWTTPPPRISISGGGGIFSGTTHEASSNKVSGSSNHWQLASSPSQSTKYPQASQAWFSLVRKPKHKDTRTCRMAYLAQFLIPALLNPMINKMADEAFAVLLKSGLKWPMIGPQPSAYACAYVDPVFTCLHMCLSLCFVKTEL